MKKLIITLSLAFAGLFTSAQDYTTSLGLRLGGWENGITLKHFLGDGAALEGILSSRWRGWGLTGLYEIQNPIAEVDGLYWYVGGGAHIGQYDYRYWGKYTYTGGTTTVVGVDGILGLEYVIPGAPLNISVDWKPAFNLIGAGPYAFWGDSGALSVRYIF